MVKGLGLFGYDADCAGTLLEGVAKLSSNVRWLVLDLRLPDGEGVALLRYIRQHELPVSVAVVTGDGNGARLAETVLLKPDALFTKPVDFCDVANWMASTEHRPPGGEDLGGAGLRA
jgi:ActR/RegA family two-component response regulator